MSVTFPSTSTRAESVVLHEGLVVACREQNLYHDSYFSATYFNPETGGFESMEYGSTAYSGGGMAEVDAPPALLEYYNDVQREIYARFAAEDAAAAAAKEAATPSVGKTVKVVKGRKVKVGTVAEVVWYGTSGYGYHPTYRVGLLVEGERVYTAASNVEVQQGVTA